MAQLRHIHTKNAPEPIGAYSQAVISGDLVFISGQIPINPETGEMYDDDIKKQTRQCLLNVKSIAEAAGTGLDKSVKINIYLADMNNFQSANEAYGEFFSEKAPARLAIQVAKLPKNADIEIEAIASL